MREKPELPLVNGRLDRDADTRLSEEALALAWAEEGTLLLRLHEGQLPLRRRREGDPGGRGGLVVGAEGDAVGEDRGLALDLVPVRGALGAEHFFLGRAEGVAVFAATASESDGYAEPQEGWRHPLRLEGALQPLELEIMAVAFALVNWHGSAGFSSRDGEATSPAQGGWARVDAHGGEHFPRTDPAVIVLIEHEDRVLLGSNALWEANRFSLLAGFVEAGESAEQAVRREVYEESGVPIGEVRYVSSQPWPFPRSLMLGFRASLADGADPEALAPDVSEISELRWFTRRELQNPATGIRLPGPLSIARWLLDVWIAEGDGAAGGHGASVGADQRDDPAGGAASGR